MTDHPNRPDSVAIPQNLPTDATMTFGRPADAPDAETLGTPLPGLPVLSVQLAEDPETLAPLSIESPATPIPATTSYRLKRLIARGGMGEVWEATQTALARTVAVKRVRANASGLEDRVGSQKAFREEAVISARLEHPNIVPVHDLGVDEDGSPLLAMKLIEGTSWADELRRDFPELSVEAFLARHIPILVAVGQAVAFAHSRGIVHRDLKPQQVMLGGYGEVLLTDWGLAMVVDRDGQGTPQSKDADEVMLALPGPESATSPSGTPAFMAPEQTLTTARGIGFHTDIYLLGATLYMLLTGEPPHEGRTSIEVFRRAAEGTVVPPSERLKGTRTVPQDLQDLCLQCLRKEPADRLGSAREFVAALQDYSTGAVRRRESIAMAERASARLKGDPETYGLFTEVTALVDQARLLWPGNGALPPLRHEAVLRHARLAARSGDLRLARLLAEQLDPRDSDRTGVLRGVAEAESRLAAQARQRRRLVGAVMILLTAMLVGASIMSVSINRARNLAEEREQQVRSARTDSEQMLQFMIGDLRKRLAELDRLDLLNEAAESALDYYERQPFAALNEDERLELVTGLNELVVLLAEQGRADLVERATDLGLGMIAQQEELVPGSTNTLKWTRLSYALRTRRMMALAARGRIDEARESIPILQKEAFAALEQGTLDAATWGNLMVNCAAVLGEAGDREAAREILGETQARLDNLPQNAVVNEDLDLQRMQVLRRRASIETLSGNPAVAAELLPRVLEYARQRHRLAPDSEAERRDLSQALLEMGRHLRSSRRLADAIGPLREALEIHNQRIASNPTSISLRTGKVVIIGDLTASLDGAGRADEASVLIEEGLAEARRLIASVPEDVNLPRNLSALLSQKSNMLSRRGLATEAIATSEENIALLRQMSQSSGTRQTRIALATGLNFHGLAFRNAQRPLEAIPHHEEAIAISRALCAESPKDLDLRKRLAESLAFYGAVLEACHRGADAEVVYREVIALAGSILEAQPTTAAVEQLRTTVRTSLSSSLLLQGRVSEAADVVRQSVDASRAALRRDPASPVLAAAFASAGSNAASTMVRAVRIEEARALADEVLEAVETFRAAHPGRLAFDEFIAAHSRRVSIYRRAVPEPAPGVFSAAVEAARLARAEPTLTLRSRNEASDLLMLAAEDAIARDQPDQTSNFLTEARAIVQPALDTAGTTTSAAIVAADVEFLGARLHYALGRREEAAVCFQRGNDLLSAAEADPSVRNFARRTRLDAQLMAIDTLTREDFRNVFGPAHEALPATYAQLADEGLPQFDALLLGLRVRGAVARELRLGGDSPQAVLASLGDELPNLPDGAERSLVEPAARVWLERALALTAMGSDASAEVAAARASIESLRTLRPLSEGTLILSIEAAPLLGTTTDLGDEYRATKAARGILRRDLRQIAEREGW